MATNAPSPVRLAELLSPAAILLQLQSSQRNDLLAELVVGIPDLADQPDNRQKVLRALIDREEMHSTGVGDGVALPHARNPLQTLLTRPQIVFGRHPTGIAYGSIDGQPAQLFFLLLATNMSQHLHILARVSRLMRQAVIRQQLLSAKMPEEVMAIIRTAEASLP